MSSQIHSAVLIAAMALVTMLTRFLPFFIFSGKKPIPRTVLYLGDVLPSAALGMLVVYCLKDVNFLTGTHGIPEMLACAAVAVLQAWKRNSILSIFAGTAFYMLILRFV